MRSIGSRLDRLASIARKRRPSARTFSLGFGRRRDAGGGDVGAGLRQRDRDALAQAGVGAGDEGDLALQVERLHAHASPYLSWQMSSWFMSV